MHAVQGFLLRSLQTPGVFPNEHLSSLSGFQIVAEIDWILLQIGTQETVIGILESRYLISGRDIFQTEFPGRSI